MIKSFSEFINENMDQNLDFIRSLAHNLLDKIRTSSKEESSEYSSFAGMEFETPFMFDLILYLRRESDPDLESDSQFNGLDWESINFKDLGYAIDANTKMSALTSTVPSIIVHLIMDPKKEPISYSNLYYRLVDLLTHETNHLDQLGLNRDPFNVNVSAKEDRENAKKTSNYFLLRDEIESYVEGMYTRSKEEGSYLDEIFSNYLKPMVKSKFITTEEYSKVMKAWIIRSAEYYPDANFSPKANQILNSI
jgi:hypothetical protein